MKSNKKKLYFFFSILFIIILNSPYFFINGGIYIGDSWDFLDSNLVWNKLISENNALFEPNNFQIKQYMSSYRISFGSEFNIFTLLIHFFGPYLGVVISKFIVQLFAFIGMFLLINKYIFNTINVGLNCIISLTFSLLPFWIPGGLAIGGIPLLIYYFINILKNSNRWYYWLYLVFYCLYSNFFVFGLFILSFQILILIVYFFKYKRISKISLLWIFSMIFLYILIEYRMFIEMLYSHTFISQRIEFYYTQNIKSVILQIILFLKNGQPHVLSFHFPIILLLSIISLFISFYYNQKNKYIIAILWALLLIIIIFASFWNYDLFYGIKSKIPLLTSFQFDRFYILFPLIWYLLYSLSVNSILIQFKYKYIYIILFFICFLQFGFVLKSNTQFIGINDYLKDKKEILTYNDYYAQNVFLKIKKQINKPISTYRVMSIGIHPSILAYNGFYTIDGYSAYYPLSYKKEFRKIIENELNQNEDSKKYFDNWGSRCYIFDNEINTNFDIIDKSKIISNLDLNYEQVKKMKCQYIISAYEILNPKDKLILIKVYKDKIRNYYLYKIK